MPAILNDADDNTSLPHSMKNLSGKHRMSTASISPSLKDMLMESFPSQSLDIPSSHHSLSRKASLSVSSKQQKRLSAVISLKKQMIASYSSASLNRLTKPDSQETNIPSNSPDEKKKGRSDYAAQRWKKVCGDVSDVHIQGRIGSTSRTPCEQALYEKILKRRLPVNRYLKSASASKKKPSKSARMSVIEVPNDSPLVRSESPFGCKRCLHPLETIEHLIFECNLAVSLWPMIRDLAMDLLQLSEEEFLPITLRDVVYFFPELVPRLCPEEIHVLAVLHASALWSLWTGRCFAFQFETLQSIFLTRLEARIVTEYRQHVPDYLSHVLSFPDLNSVLFPSSMSPLLSDADSSYAFSSAGSSIAGTRDSWIDNSRPLSGISVYSNETTTSLSSAKDRSSSVATNAIPLSSSTFEIRWCAGSVVRVSPLGPIFALNPSSPSHLSCF